MAFHLRPNEYFRGVVVEPEGARREFVVVNKATRASAVNLTLAEARRRNWDWVIQLLRTEEDEAGTVTELARWSEIAGDNPPPRTRAEVLKLG